MTNRRAQSIDGCGPGWRWNSVPTSRNHARSGPAALCTYVHSHRRRWLLAGGTGTSDGPSGPMPLARAQREWAEYLGGLFSAMVIHNVAVFFQVPMPCMYLYIIFLDLHLGKIIDAVPRNSAQMSGDSCRQQRFCFISARQQLLPQGDRWLFLRLARCFGLPNGCKTSIVALTG